MKRLLFVLLVASALAAPASAEKRVARVVGNSTYKSVAQLDNPNNDAALMTRTLKALGFVIVGGDARTDLDKLALDEACRPSDESFRAPTSRCSTMPATVYRSTAVTTSCRSTPIQRGRRTSTSRCSTSTS
jgi:hypothetical protein